MQCARRPAKGPATSSKKKKETLLKHHLDTKFGAVPHGISDERLTSLVNSYVCTLYLGMYMMYILSTFRYTGQAQHEDSGLIFISAD